jgi:hypothetical protein
LNELLGGSNPQVAAACVAIAALLPAWKDKDWTEEVDFIKGFARIDTKQQINLIELLGRVDESMEDFAPIMNLPIPEKPLLAYLASQAS